MSQTIEFSTILLDITRIEIPVHLQAQLKANQSVRVIISIDEATEKWIDFGMKTIGQKKL